MKSKWTKIAASVAALIIIGIVGFIALFTQGKSVAFADVVRPFMTARTATFKITVNLEGGPSQTSECMFMEPSHIRQTMPGSVMITDHEQGKTLTLSPAQKMAIVTEMKNMPEKNKNQSDTNMFLNIRRLIQKAETDDDKSVEFLGEKEIDGQKAIGYQILSEAKAGFSIWVDAESLLPIQIECSFGDSLLGKKATAIMSDFSFNVNLEESLFSLDVPEGYSVHTMQMDVSKPGEEDLIEAFRLYTDASGGKLPPDLNISKAMVELLNVVKERKAPLHPDRDQEAPEQQKQQKEEVMEVYAQIGPRIARGLGLFVQQLPADSDWHYAGKDVKFGDANAPIFWYRPEGSKTYRVIYGDLSVRDVSIDQLPPTPAGQEDK